MMEMKDKFIEVSRRIWNRFESNQNLHDPLLRIVNALVTCNLQELWALASHQKNTIPVMMSAVYLFSVRSTL